MSIYMNRIFTNFDCVSINIWKSANTSILHQMRWYTKEVSLRYYVIYIYIFSCMKGWARQWLTEALFAGSNISILSSKSLSCVIFLASGAGSRWCGGASSVCKSRVAFILDIITIFSCNYKNKFKYFIKWKVIKIFIWIF